MIAPRSAPSLHVIGCATRLLLLLTGLCGSLSAFAQQDGRTLSEFIVFGDSFSDTGNFRDRANSASGGTVDYPSGTYNYSAGRFTNSSDTNPSSTTYAGVWHEQLAGTFLGLPTASYSLAGGTDYAFGGATTENGTRDVQIFPTPSVELTVTIDNVGKQMDDFLATHAVDPNALYIVWGGIVDLLNDDSATSVSATAARVTALVSRLAKAGAQFIMVPNVLPLGSMPHFASAPAVAAAKNAASANYRRELDADLTASLRALAPQGLTPTIYRVDVWTNTIRLLAYPGSYGFTDVSNAALGTSNATADHFLFWDDLHLTTAGHYWTASSANDALAIPLTPPAKAVNISTRVFVDTGERVSVAGFIVTGDVPKKVLLRGIGPSLAANGVPTPLADPTLTLFDDAGSTLMMNNNWRDSQEAEIMATGIPPQNDLESAIVATLAPGHYTAVLAGQNGTVGNGLAEVYDLEPGTNATLANLSTRGFVGAGDSAMIGGVIIGNGDLPIVVLRAIGPTLASSGIANPLLDPTIELHDGNGAVIGLNDNWKDGQLQAVMATQLAPSDDRESVIVAFLAPGNYTAVVRGRDDNTGVALVEAYRVP